MNTPVISTVQADRAALQIDALLPQTQCGRCGYPGCLPYAEAIAHGEAAINRCPPGGQRVIDALATLLARAPLPLDPECGAEIDRGVAWIDPEGCTGCARCLPACPVDAIVGTSRLLHTVYAAQCTGCELCIGSCPVDCIRLQPRLPGQSAPSAADNRRRFERHAARLGLRARTEAQLLIERKQAARAPPPVER